MLLLLLAAFAATTPAKNSGDSTVPGRRPSEREIGETTWRQSCSACHGATGKGDGPSAAAVVGGVATLVGKIPENDDAIPAIVDVVERGRGRMPAFSDTLERGDMRLTVLYIRDVLAGRVPAKPEKPEKPEPAEEAAGAEGDAP